MAGTVVLAGQETRACIRQDMGVNEEMHLILKFLIPIPFFVYV